MKKFKRNKLNSKGFSHVEAFVLLVLVIAIAGVGYVVYKDRSTSSVANAGSSTFFLQSSFKTPYPVVYNQVAAGFMYEVETGAVGTTIQQISIQNPSKPFLKHTVAVDSYVPLYEAFDSANNVLYIVTSDNVLYAYQVDGTPGAAPALLASASLTTVSGYSDIKAGGLAVVNDTAYVSFNPIAPNTTPGGVLTFELETVESKGTLPQSSLVEISNTNLAWYDSPCPSGSNCLVLGNDLLFQGTQDAANASENSLNVYSVTSGKVVTAPALNNIVSLSSGVDSVVANGDEAYVAGQNGTIEAINFQSNGLYSSGGSWTIPTPPTGTTNNIDFMAINPDTNNLYSIVTTATTVSGSTTNTASLYAFPAFQTSSTINPIGKISISKLKASGPDFSLSADGRNDIFLTASNKTLIYGINP